MLLLICAFMHSATSGYNAGYLFEVCYFVSIMGSAKNSENYMPVKNTSYTVIIYNQA